MYGEISWKVDNKEEYREFKDIESSQAWGMENYKEWSENYKKVMKKYSKLCKNNLYNEPIECYCGYSYREISKFLRYGIDSEYHTYRELSDILSLVLCTVPTIPCNLVVYRIVNDEFINAMIENNKSDIPLPMHEKGFMSTSLLKTIADENEAYTGEKNLLKIFVPKGTVGIYVNTIAMRSEEEMLLLPNMYLGLISYPYEDKEVKKIIFECKLIHFN